MKNIENNINNTQSDFHRQGKFRTFNRHRKI